MTTDTGALLLAVGLAGVLLLSMWLLWMLECEKELREQAESRVTTTEEDLRLLVAVEEAACGMYSVLCAGGTLTVASPQARAYKRALDAYWKAETDETTA